MQTMPKSHRQLLLDPSLASCYQHGGSLGIGKRKIARPIATRRPMHLVFKAEGAKGKLSLLLPQNVKWIDFFKARFTRKFDVKVYEFANAGTHLHFLLRAKTREGFQSFLRAFAGLTALKVTGAGKDHPHGKRFWTYLVYSRILFWGRAFKITQYYVILNRLEATGLIPYEPRKHRSPRTSMPP